jgi:hypothetical protein
LIETSISTSASQTNHPFSNKFEMLEAVEQGSYSLGGNHRQCGECEKLPLTEAAGHVFIRIQGGTRRYFPLIFYPDLDNFRARVLLQKLKNKRNVRRCCWKDYAVQIRNRELEDGE